MGKYLDSDGLGYFWGKIKAYVQQQIQAIGAITGVKGDAESTYRTGNVNLTPANIGVGAIGLKNSLSASDIPSLPYLPTSGGTVSGGNVDVKSTNIADGTTPSSDTIGDARVLFSGSNGVNLGWVDVTNFSTGVQTLRLYARRVVNGVTKYCGVLLGLDSSGNPSVQLSSPAAWRTALGTYERSSAGTLDWGTNNEYLVAKSALAYWNGAYSGTASNLAYCNKGAFGTMATKSSLAASDIPNHSTSKLTSGTLGIARGGTGSTGTTSKLNNSYATIYIWGKLVMVQLHGQTKTPDGTAIWSTAYLADYKPGYNASAIVAATTGELARVWVGASDGKIYLSAVNTSTSKAWYGTLVYMLA